MRRKTRLIMAVLVVIFSGCGQEAEPVTTTLVATTQATTTAPSATTSPPQEPTTTTTVAATTTPTTTTPTTTTTAVVATTSSVPPTTTTTVVPGTTIVPPTTTTTVPPTTTLPVGPVHRVSLTEFLISPATITISVGDTVRWTNNGTIAHTTTSGQGGTFPGNANGLWDSGTLGLGASYQRTFGAAGTFTYFCSFHPILMGTATVIVEG